MCQKCQCIENEELQFAKKDNYAILRNICNKTNEKNW